MALSSFIGPISLRAVQPKARRLGVELHSLFDSLWGLGDLGSKESCLGGSVRVLGVGLTGGCIALQCNARLSPPPSAFR